MTLRLRPSTLRVLAWLSLLGAAVATHAFLLRGDVFTEELIETFIDYKRKNEADAMRLRPHPYEFALYYDI